MACFETEIEIAAPAADTWSAVANVGQWPAWTASVRQVEGLSGGGLALGSRWRVKQPGVPAMTWTVTALAPGHSFTWTARSPGVVTVAEHQIESLGEGSSRLRLAVKQDGPAAWLIARLMGARTRRFLSLEAHGMKACAEAARRPSSS